MKKQRMNHLGKKLAEQMSPDEWAVWIAGRFAQCESTREYLTKAFEGSDTRRSDFHRPQFSCEYSSAKNKDEFEVYRQVAFQCRLRSHLALEVNSQVDDLRTTLKNKHNLRMTQYQLYTARLFILSLTVPADRGEEEFWLKCNIASIFGEYDEFVLPTLDAISEAVDSLAKELYGGKVFLTLENQRGMDDHIEQALAFREMVGQEVEDNTLMPEECYQERKERFRDHYKDKWLSESRTHVRVHVYGDDSLQKKLIRRNLAGPEKFLYQASPQ